MLLALKCLVAAVLVSGLLGMLLFDTTHPWWPHGTWRSKVPHLYERIVVNALFGMFFGTMASLVVCAFAGGVVFLLS